MVSALGRIVPEENWAAVDRGKQCLKSGVGGMLAHTHEVGGVNDRFVVWEDPCGELALVDPMPGLVNGHHRPDCLLLAWSPLGHVRGQFATHVLDRKPVKACGGGPTSIEHPSCAVVGCRRVGQQAQLFVRLGKVCGADL